MAFVTNLGYTTINNKWEVLTNKELAKHDLLLQIYTRKGECDWQPEFGTTIMDKLFQPKTTTIRNLIIDELQELFNNDLRFTLYNIDTQDVEDGWYFICTVGYLEGTPEQWILNITETEFKSQSKGYYPLRNED